MSGRCGTCLYLQLEIGGGYCYMFKERPSGQCAQWRGCDGVPEAANRLSKPEIDMTYVVLAALLGWGFDAL